MATGTSQLGILGDATYKKVSLTDDTVFTGTIYVTRIGPFVQISGAGIKLKNALAANSRVYSAGLIPADCRASRDFPINVLVDGKATNGGFYVNGSGTVFFMSGATAFTTSNSFSFSGMYISSAYGA